MELVRAEELSNFLNRSDNSMLSREEVSKLGEALAATLNAGRGARTDYTAPLRRSEEAVPLSLSDSLAMTQQAMRDVAVPWPWGVGPWGRGLWLPLPGHDVSDALSERAVGHRGLSGGEAWPDTNRYHREAPRAVEPVAVASDAQDAELSELAKGFSALELASGDLGATAEGPGGGPGGVLQLRRGLRLRQLWAEALRAAGPALGPL